MLRKNSNTQPVSSKRERIARRTGAGALAAVLGATVSPVLAATPAEAKEKVSCTGSDFRCDKNGYREVAQRSFWTMAPGHNCTNYMAFRLIKAGMSTKVQWLHDAGDWAREARSHDYAVNDVPEVGAVAQWTGGQPNISTAGHVAMVEAVTETSMTITEDNYPSGPLRVRVISKGDKAWPSHFIHFDQRTGDKAPIPAPVDPSLPLPVTPGFPQFDWVAAWFPTVQSTDTVAEQWA